MKTTALILIFCLGTVYNLSAQAELGRYEFSTGTACGTIDVNVTSQPANASFSVFSVSSNDPCAVSAAGEYISKTWTNTSSANVTDFYHTLTLTANANYRLDLTEISFDIYRPNSPAQGPDSCAVYTSIDGGPYTRQGGISVITTTKTNFSRTFTISSATSGNIAFRITGWNAQNSGENSRLGIDNIIITGTVSNVLPIELISFNATPIANNVSLTWSTASEINNDYFTLERSINAIYFVEIETIDGAGNSNQILNYSHVDGNVISGVSYYKLKQTDYDGKFEYSDIVSVNLLSFDEIKIYPNPFDGSVLFLNTNILQGKNIQLRIIDFNGREIISKVLLLKESNENNLDELVSLENIPDGLYIINVISENKTFNQKLIVRK